MNIGVVESATASAVPSAVISLPKKDKTIQEPLTKSQSDSKGGDVKNEQVSRMIQDMQDQINRMSVSLEFSTYGSKGEKIAVIVADKETGEVIREIPSKELQQLHAKLDELVGMIFNKTA